MNKLAVNVVLACFLAPSALAAGDENWSCTYVDNVEADEVRQIELRIDDGRLVDGNNIQATIIENNDFGLIASSVNLGPTAHFGTTMSALDIMIRRSDGKFLMNVLLLAEVDGIPASVLATGECRLIN